MMKDGKFKYDVKILTSCTGIYLQVPYDKLNSFEKRQLCEEKVHDKLEKRINKLSDCCFRDQLIKARDDIVENFDKLPEKRKFISLDPGIRTFLTGIDSRGDKKEFGIGLIEDLQSCISKRNESQRRLDVGEPITKAVLQRKYAKISNKVKDYHCCISKKLEMYDTILLPKLSTKSVCDGKRGSFNDNAHILAHCKFFDRMRMNHPGLIEADERYTTKMCCRCFCLNEIGSSKEYKCDECGFEADRDMNSAVNILVKNFPQMQGFYTSEVEIS